MSDTDQNSGEHDLERVVNELKNRLTTLENQRDNLKKYVGLAGLALVIFFGVSWIQIPRTLEEKVTKAATQEATDAAAKAAERHAEEHVKETMPVLVKAQVELQIPTMIESATDLAVDRYVATRHKDFDHVRDRMLIKLVDVFAESVTTVRAELEQVQKQTDAMDATTIKMIAQAKSLESRFKALETSKAAEIGSIVEALEKAPNANAILDRFNQIRELIDFDEHGRPHLTLGNSAFLSPARDTCLFIPISSAVKTGLKIQAAAAQTTPPFVIADNVGGEVFSVGPSGDLTLNLPESEPRTPRTLWNDDGIVKVSQ